MDISQEKNQKTPSCSVCVLVLEVSEFDVAFGKAENLVARAVGTRVKVE